MWIVDDPANLCVFCIARNRGAKPIFWSHNVGTGVFFGWLFLLFHRHLCTVWDSRRLTRVATVPDFVYSFLVSSAVNKVPVHHHQSPVFGLAFNLQLHSLPLPRSLTEESSRYGSSRLLPAQEL